MDSCWVHRDGEKVEAKYIIAVDGPHFHKEHGLCDMHGRALDQVKPDYHALQRDANPARVREIVAAGQDPRLKVAVNQRTRTAHLTRDGMGAGTPTDASSPSRPIGGTNISGVLPIVKQAKLEAVVEQAWPQHRQPDQPGPHDQVRGGDQPRQRDRAGRPGHQQDAREPLIREDQEPLLREDRLSGEQRLELANDLAKVLGRLHGIPDVVQLASEVAEAMELSIPGGPAGAMPVLDYARIKLEAMREQVRARAEDGRYPAQRPTRDAGRDRT